MDRPEDSANLAYYTHMPTRRMRVVWEADVEWREDDPDYSLGVASVTWPYDTLRMRNAHFVAGWFCDDEDEDVVDDDA